MSYIKNKLDEFKNIKLIDGQEADGIMENSKRLSEWIEQALTDYHNHIVEKIEEWFEDKGANMNFDILLSILQDTNK